VAGPKPQISPSWSSLSSLSSKVTLVAHPLDVDPEKWRSLYVVKLKACSRQADFSDSKKDTEYKDQKKEAMIDLIDILDDAQNAP
jgi:hypothetical protein